MDYEKKLKNAYSLYNLCRYVFLRIENEYNNIVEASGITLPQLRVLWIIKSFPGISLGEIASIGCWTSPTVTKMLQILMAKGLVAKDNYDNKKLYRLNITKDGERYIQLNKQTNNDKFPLLKICKVFSEDELILITNVLKEIAINDSNEIILSYIESINKSEMKIDYKSFTFEERNKLQIAVRFYNILRVFILNIEGEHRKLLSRINLTYPQLRGLWIIEAFPGITSSKLSEISFWAPSTSNVIVKNLYRKKLIYKEKSQLKNSLYLFISESGEELILKDFKENQHELSTFNDLINLNQIDISSINTILDRMNKYLGNDRVEEYLEKTFQIIKNRVL